VLVQPEPGDKVRVKSGPHAGERGIVVAVEGDKFLVRLAESGQAVRVLAQGVTNFSLAARKAWVTDPNRAVGRRKGTKLCDRVSVTLRLDRDLWERFRAMEGSGLIEDRTAAVNRWLREKLDELAGEERRR
jgi:uncharacterized protein (DUF4415 family)